MNVTTNGLAIVGVPIDSVSMHETLERIEGFIREGSFHQVATANVDYLVNAATNPYFKEILCRCDLVVADGMPLVLASRLLGYPLRERVAGSDLVPLLGKLSAEKGYGIFLLGAQPEVSDLAARELEGMGARIVGRLAPPMRSLGELDHEEILAAIERAQPDILLVAFGSPKQEMWIHRHRHRLKVPVCIGIGASLDFLAGKVRRAPQWMRQGSFEWLFRLWEEPRRLAPRYIKDAIWMARFFGVQLAASLTTRQSGPPLHIGVEAMGSVTILSASGRMTGPRLAKLERAAFSIAKKCEALVVEMTGVTYLGADGLRTLSGLLRAARSHNCPLWLAGVRPAVARTIRASCSGELFVAVPSLVEAVWQASPGRLQISLVEDMGPAANSPADSSGGLRRPAVNTPV
jgi:N-acetylglucosaminyldiphosphoundecaprenol N-acetyl-beta-D-mannosaminyltransferase